MQKRPQHDADPAQTVVIFDFDGVIADSHLAIDQVIQFLAKKKGIAPPTLAQLQTLPTRDIFRLMRIRWYEIPYWLRAARREMTQHIDAISLHKGIRDVFAWIKQRSLDTAIVSSNSESLIRAVLANHLADYPVARMAAGASLFSKHRALAKVTRAYTKSIYIGDEVRDIEAAQRCATPSIAVTWGKEGNTLLAAAKPTWLVHDSAALIAALEDWLERLP